ncbi:MAG: hypothetical protein U0X93_05415 [Anaerolineales bacterium]
MNLFTNGQGAVTLAKSYQPYGETLSSAGNGSSPFAFTGEQTDVSGLTYSPRALLLKRHRFLPAIHGWEIRPLSLNSVGVCEGGQLC